MTSCIGDNPRRIREMYSEIKRELANVKTWVEIKKGLNAPELDIAYQEVMRLLESAEGQLQALEEEL